MVTQEGIDAVFKALSDPTRRSILASLRAQALPVAAISQEYPAMSRPAISKHLRILRQAGLVAEEQRGRQRFYRLMSGSLDEVGSWVESFMGLPQVGQTATHRAPRVRRDRPGGPAESDGWRVW